MRNRLSWKSASSFALGVLTIVTLMPPLPVVHAATIERTSFSGRTQPLLDRGNGAYYDAQTHWSGGGGQGPALLISGLSAGQTVSVSNIQGNIDWGSGNASCENGEASHTVPKLVAMVQFVNDNGNVVPLSDGGINYDGPTNALYMRQLKGGYTVPAGATKLYGSFPDSDYGDNDGSCSFNLSVDGGGSAPAAQDADMSISVTANQDLAIPTGKAGAIQFKVKLTNHGNGIAEDILFDGSVPDGFVFNPQNSTSTCKTGGANGSIICNGGSLTAGNSKEGLIGFDLLPAACGKVVDEWVSTTSSTEPANKRGDNLAGLTLVAQCKNQGGGSSSSAPAPQQKADLTVGLTATPSPVIRTDNQTAYVQYQVTIGNIGTVTAENIRFDVSIPHGFVFNAKNSSETCRVTAQNSVYCDPSSSLDPNGTPKVGVIGFDIPASAVACGNSFIATASVTSDTPEKDLSNNVSAPLATRLNCQNTPVAPQCSDGKDNDGDNRIDALDPGCHTDNNPTNPTSYNPLDTNEGDEPACSDGKDNDGDGRTDAQDPACHVGGNPNNPYIPSGPTENGEPQCVDNRDNDNDNKVDSADPGCHTDGNPNNPTSYNPIDNDERDPAASSSSSPSGTPVLTIDKTTQQTSVRPGEPIFYTITVRNVGDVAATNIRVIDNVPYGTTYVPAGSTAGCVLASVNGISQVQCQNIVALTRGGTATYTLKFMVNVGQLACGQGQMLRNQADIESHGGVQQWDDVFTTILCNDASSSSAPTLPQCSDGVDNADPEDTVADTFDSGCYTNGIYNPNDNDETNAPVVSSSSSSQATLPQCSDGVDNADPEDTVADTFDIGCYTNGIYNPNDNDETNVGVSSSSVSSVSERPDLTIEKSANVSTVNQGGQIVYTITVRESGIGQASAEQVVVTDIIPAGTFFVTSSGASCTQNTATTVACTLGTIHNDQNRTFTLTFQTFGGVQCNSSITNYATVSTVTTESNGNNNISQTVSTPVQCNGSSSSSSNQGCIEVVKFAYDLNGNSINVVPQFTFTLDGNRTAVNGSNGHARFDNVSNGTHTVIESVPSGWSLISVSPSNGTVNVNGSSCAQVIFQNRQNSISGNTFTIDISDDETEVEAGDTLEYVIKVRNTSNQNINGVTMTATMDDEVNIEDVSNGGDDNGRLVTWNNLSFNANEQKTFHVEVEVDDDADGTLRASAQILSFSDSDNTDVDDVDSDEDEDDDDDDNDDAEIDLSKEANTSEVFPGGIVEYTLRIRNTGDTDIEDLKVEDRLPSGITIVDDGDADSRSGNRLVWEIDRLAEGKTWTVRYRVAVNAYLTPGTILRNSVVVTSDDDDIDEAEGVTVAVIGNMPQTGYGSRGTGMLLSPITRRAGSSAAIPLSVIVSMLGMGTGAGIGLGKKYFLGL